MFKFIVTVCLFFNLLCSQLAYAEWEFKNSRWLGKEIYSLYQAAEKSPGGLLLSSNNVDSIIVKIMFDKETLKLKNSKVPFIVKGRLLFDDKKYADLSLKNGLNVHKLPGEEYELDDYMFDGDMYEAFKNSKILKFEYIGKNDKNYSLVVPLEDYFSKYNQYVTYRRKEFIPAFLSEPMKKKYIAVVSDCIALAEGQTHDLEAKNKGISLSERQAQVISQTHSKADKPESEQLKVRVASAYQYVADISQPEWLLYPLFTDCFNRHVDELN